MQEAFRLPLFDFTMNGVPERAQSMEPVDLATCKQLNVGSGEFPKEGFVNVDFYARIEPDVSHDLNSFPYPFEENRFELIEADHVLEHLNDPFGVMKELHRIAADGAQIVIRVPHFSRGFTHADHRRGFDLSFPYYFNPSFQGGYQGLELTLESARLTWLTQKYLKKTIMSPLTFKIGVLLDTVFNFFANLHPFVCSRIWCFWVGGFEEVEFKFRVVKSKNSEH